MTPRNKGLLIAAVQLALVLSLGVKLLYDRATRPRVWVQCETYDPSLPIRGRYLAESLHMKAEGFDYTAPTPQNANAYWANRVWAHMEVENGQLVARKTGTGPGAWAQLQKNPAGNVIAVTEQPVLLFVSESAQIPTLARGDELWLEVTVPAKGPPRPIRLGIKKNGVLTPIHLE